MPTACWEPRLAPLGNTFINLSAPPSGASVRHRSFAGYLTSGHRAREVRVDALRSFAASLEEGRAPATPVAGRAAAPSPGRVPGLRLPAAARGPGPVGGPAGAPEPEGRGGCGRWSELDGSDGGEPSTTASSTEASPRDAAPGGGPGPWREAAGGAERQAAEGHGGPGAKAEGFTTLMIRNLPHDIEQSDVVQELDASGFRDEYDFVYMPSTFSSGRGKGYAFANFVSQAVAQSFVQAWHRSHRFGIPAAGVPLNVSAASVQGRDANVKKWDVPRMRRVKNPNYRPLVATAPAPGGGRQLVPNPVGGGAAGGAEAPHHEEACGAPRAGRAPRRGGRAPSAGARGRQRRCPPGPRDRAQRPVGARG